MGRQFHLRGISGNYYIDLVFYNVILKCYVLIDLKVGKVTHQDVGQMDMYVRMFDDFYRRDDDSPTLGIVLCSDTDADISRYSILAGSDQLFASKYKLYLPTNEELRAEIESQKALFEQRITGERGTPDPRRTPDAAEPSEKHSAKRTNPCKRRGPERQHRHLGPRRQLEMSCFSDV